jgi:hypothetical protein
MGGATTPWSLKRALHAQRLWIKEPLPERIISCSEEINAPHDQINAMGQELAQEAFK